MAVDPTVQQVLAQNSHIAQALYDLTKALTAPLAANTDALYQDAKTHVNALDPERFTF